jgi:hypothetical protein
VNQLVHVTTQTSATVNKINDRIKFVFYQRRTPFQQDLRCTEPEIDFLIFYYFSYIPITEKCLNKRREFYLYLNSRVHVRCTTDCLKLTWTYTTKNSEDSSLLHSLLLGLPDLEAEGHMLRRNDGWVLSSSRGGMTWMCTLKYRKRRILLIIWANID